MKKVWNKTKTIILICCVCMFALLFTACALAEDKVVTSFGKYESYKFYTSGGFRNYTDYAKYQYKSANVEENKHLKKIQESDKEVIFFI